MQGSTSGQNETSRFDEERQATSSGSGGDVVVKDLLRILPTRVQDGYRCLEDILKTEEREVLYTPASILSIALVADDIHLFDPISQPA